MKKTFAILAMFLAGCAGSHGPQMRMVVDEHGVVGRYVSETADAYMCSVQEDRLVPKDGLRVEVWRAEDGQGVLYMRDFGKAPVRMSADTDSDIIGYMVYEEGCVPEVYPCGGYADGWFSTEIDGRTGFVEEACVAWDGMNTF